MVEWINSCVINTHHPKGIVEMDADGAGEFISKSFFFALGESKGNTLRTGTPYQHTNQTTVERQHGTIQRMSVTMRIAVGMPPEWSVHSDRQSVHIL